MAATLAAVKLILCGHDMRTVTNDFAARMNLTTTTFSRLWKITRVDGTVVTITDHDSNILYSGAVYKASIGFTQTAVLTSSLSIGSQSVELTVPLTDLGITEADLRHRIYENATAVEYVIDWQHPEFGVLTLFSGRVGRSVLSDKKRATLEIISSTDPNLFIADEQYSATCRNDLGDAHCQFPIFNFQVNFIVTGIIDNTAFTVDTLAGQSDNYFSLGQIKWTSGDNTSVISDVLSSNLNQLSLALFYPLPLPIQVGDHGQLLTGCDKSLTTCFKKFNNVINFRGEPFAPSFGG